MLKKIAFAAAMSMAPTTAHAAWRSATSTHFIIYTEGSTQNAHDLAARLEKFEFVMRTLAGVKQPGSPVRTKVFMMNSSAAVQATMPFGGGSGVAGYFDGDIRGPYAVMTRSDSGEEFALGAETVLFHELSHQFMFRFFPAAYPSWYVEGFADFYGTMTIDPKDRVELGRPLENRLMAFGGNNWLPLTKILGARNYGDVGDVGMLYSEGWLLVHYLTTTNKRPGQLKTYLDAINNGVSFEAAAKQAFGDLGKLDTELHLYSGNAKQQTLVLPFKPIDTGPIQTATLNPAQDAMIGYDIRLFAGVPASQVSAFCDRVEEAAKRFPDDPYALGLLTEAQRLAGRNDAALATITHWIQVAPQDGIPLMHKAAITIAALRGAKNSDAAQWKDVRGMLVAANSLTANDPRILSTYYDLFAAQSAVPPVNAQAALVQAFDLLPEDDELRMTVALDFERRGELQQAITTIRPLAYRLRGDADKSPADKAREDKARERYLLAGEDAKPVSPRTVLDRLERELHDKDAGK